MIKHILNNILHILYKDLIDLYWIAECKSQSELCNKSYLVVILFLSWLPCKHQSTRDHYWTKPRSTGSIIIFNTIRHANKTRGQTVSITRCSCSLFLLLLCTNMHM